MSHHPTEYLSPIVNIISRKMSTFLSLSYIKTHFLEALNKFNIFSLFSSGQTSSESALWSQQCSCCSSSCCSRGRGTHGKQLKDLNPSILNKIKSFLLRLFSFTCKLENYINSIIDLVDSE